MIKINQKSIVTLSTEIINSHVVKENDVTDEVMHTRKSIVILSDYMLNQLDETHLCKYGDVKVRSRGGCIANRMYSHLPTLLTDKPD